jgi:hypothetical protein
MPQIITVHNNPDLPLLEDTITIKKFVYSSDKPAIATTSNTNTKFGKHSYWKHHSNGLKLTS